MFESRLAPESLLSLYYAIIHFLATAVSASFELPIILRENLELSLIY